MAGFFNYSKAGKGIKKEDLDKSGVGLYFDIFGRRLWKLMTLNLMYLAVSIPAIIIVYYITTYLFTYLMSLTGVNAGEIADVIASARAELVRAGVAETTAESDDEIVETAIKTYALAYYASDVKDAERYQNSFMYQCDCLRKSYGVENV